jgi:PAS domain S-box-containing protein
MKSERARPQVRLPAGAYQAFFESLPSPAALCDAKLRVLAANAACRALLGAVPLPGTQLTDLIPGVDRAPAAGKVLEVDGHTADGRALRVVLSRKGQQVCVTLRELPPERTVVQGSPAEKALLELGREVVGARSEEQLVAVVARTLKGLFPKREFCVRFTDPRTCELTAMYAEGKLKPGARELLVFKRSAAAKTQLAVARLSAEKVRVVEDDVPLLFTGTVRSISAPLVASGQLFGMINVEYRSGEGDPQGDDRLLARIANHAALGVRNAKLIEELTFIRRYLEDLLEHANAAILVVNVNRQVTVFNRCVATLTGLSREEVVGRDLLELTPEEDRLRVKGVLASVLRGDRPRPLELRLSGKGREVRLSLSLSRVLRSPESVEGVIAIGQDVTVLKHLERRVVQAEKLASLGQVAASIVHEINNPMTAVRAYTDALLNRLRAGRPLEANDQDKLAKIMDSSERILRFTRDLVSYARPAKDRPEKVDVIGVLDLAVSFCDHVLAEHNVHVEREYRAVPKVAGMRGSLVQVFVNLITNACHAMPAHGAVHLSTEPEEGCVCIRVRDTGRGIPSADLERIFEPFYTTKPDGHGTGLGLSIVQRIIDSHGGSITVESRVDFGTTFVIRIPNAD